MPAVEDAFLERLRGLHESLGIPADYLSSCRLSPCPEPAELADAGMDYYRRPQRLAPDACRAWLAMRDAAAADGIVLHLISAFRSIDYQCELIRRKAESGRPMDDILRVNAAPGFSEHHTGRAIDIGTENCPALEESFEHTPAFLWLSTRAGRFGFSLSYPRNNASGIAYEPWHWCFRAESCAG